MTLAVVAPGGCSSPREGACDDAVCTGEDAGARAEGGASDRDASSPPRGEDGGDGDGLDAAIESPEPPAAESTTPSDAGGSPSEPEEPPPWEAAQPAGEVPSCVRALPEPVDPSGTRWVAYRAQDAWGEPFGAYLLPVDAAGVGEPVRSGDVDPDWAVGRWTTSGAFFAHQVPSESATGTAVQVTRVSGSTHETTSLPGVGFWGFAGDRDTFLVRDQSVLLLHDATDLAAQPIDIALPYGTRCTSTGAPTEACTASRAAAVDSASPTRSWSNTTSGARQRGAIGC